MQDFNKMCESARAAYRRLAAVDGGVKNAMLETVAAALTENRADILSENRKDIAAAGGMPAHFIDRLTLTEKRIEAMAEGIRVLKTLPDPVGRVLDRFENRCGLRIEKVSVPIGVIGIIYEARPNVTADVIGLCIKSGNAVVLRGSKDALNSNKAVAAAVKNALREKGYIYECIQLLEDTSREGAALLTEAVGLIDVLLPRGGKGLIQSVVQNSKVPVIETGAGNCHVYVHESADFAMANGILLNAKVQRPSVCNSAETLLADRSIAAEYLPLALNALKEKGVEIRGCAETRAIWPEAKPAAEEDFYTEYNDLILAVKVVGGAEEAVEHINKYSTGHSDAIVTADARAAELFLDGVDSAAVYVNASTRFTDGFEFGFGAEMGISTQKLHARGPMGLNELTSYKYKVRGDGQVRG